MWRSISAQPQAVTIPPPVGLGRDTARRAQARAALAAVLWDDAGRRRLPTERALVAAIEACDPRDVWWVCEASSAGPVYLLPTREWVAALTRYLHKLGVRTVVEVAAGDGFLSACLSRVASDLSVVATDDMSWRRPVARMSRREQRLYAKVPIGGIKSDAHVMRLAASTAVKRFRPDLVLVSWAPLGTLVERVIRAPSSLLVLEITVDGDVCGSGIAAWRFNKEFVGGAVESRALCRLDTHPKTERRTRVTLYYGRRHPSFAQDQRLA